MTTAAEGPGGSGASASGGPRILADTSALAAGVADPEERGAVWRLTEPTRHLDSNVVAVPPHASIDPHVGPDEDVLWHVIAGGGTLRSAQEELPLEPGAIVWLPRRSPRSVIAGPEGLRYLSVHRRKSGLQIGRRPE